MEAALDEAMEDVAPTSILTFNLLLIIKRAQAQHGLRHGDYTRYRQYCARRLRRLYKGVDFLHGKKTFEKRDLTEADVRDVRHLYIPLVSAERAWAHAMELENEGGSRKRMHRIKRLRKASLWASQLASLCATTKVDGRTALEAEAYSSWMAALVLFAQEKDWEGALNKFIRTRTVYQELAQLGDMEEQVLCRERVEELEPSIRYCRYNMSKAGGSEAAGGAAELMEMAGKGPGQDLLQAKLQAVLAEERARAAESMSEIAWDGRRLPVRNNATRLCILNAQDLVKQLAGAGEYAQKEKLFDKLFLQYNDAKQHIRTDLARISGRAEEPMTAELNALDTAVTCMLVAKTLDRNALLLANHQTQLEGSGGGGEAAGGEKSKSKVKVEDLVRLCDNLLTNLGDLCDSVAGASGAAGVAEVCAVQDAALRGWRALYLAQVNLEMGGDAEAYVLLGRAAEHAQTASQLSAALPVGAPASGFPPSALSTLRVRATKQRLTVHADATAAAAAAAAELGHGVDRLELQRKAAVQGPQASQWLMDNLDAFTPFAGIKGQGVHLAQMPPPFQTVPVSPIILDTAVQAIDFPSLEAYVAPEKKKGIASRLFGGWGRNK